MSAKLVYSTTLVLNSFNNTEAFSTVFYSSDSSVLSDSILKSTFFILMKRNCGARSPHDSGTVQKVKSSAVMKTSFQKPFNGLTILFFKMKKYKPALGRTTSPLMSSSPRMTYPYFTNKSSNDPILQIIGKKDSEKQKSRKKQIYITLPLAAVRMTIKGTCEIH